jgi:putative DNA primase/helicase
MLENKKTETSRSGEVHSNDQYTNTPHFTTKANSFSTSYELEVECLRQMRLNGIPFAGKLQCDGEIQRFSIDQKKSKKDEWYAFRVWEFRGKLYFHGFYGSWSTREKYVFQSWDQVNNGLSQREKEDLAASFREIEEKAERARKKRHEDAALEAMAIWSNALKEASSDGYRAYLKLKNIDPYTVRFGSNPNGYESIIIPLWNIDGKIRSLQFISVDQSSNTVFKTFLSGGQKKGCFFVLGNLRQADSFFVGEGFSTCASIHKADGRPVVIAFDCGNLEPVIAALRMKYPTQEIIIAGDDDVEAEVNMGRTKAEVAAHAHGCKVVFPKFPKDIRLSDGKKPTDFNDLHNLLGLDAVKKQLRGEQEEIEQEIPKESTDKTDSTYPDGWGIPQEFKEMLPPVPPLNLLFLPEPLRPYVEDSADRMQCPSDFIGIALVVVISSLIGAGCGIRPKEHDSWTIMPNLWGAVVGPPSILKTPALNEGMMPLALLEKESDARYLKMRVANEAEKKLREERLKNQLKGAIESDDEGQIEAAKTAFVRLEEEGQKDRWRRYKTNDCTIQKLTEILKDNPRGILIFRDELIGFLVGLDKDGKEDDRAFYLEGWNGYAPAGVKSDRIGRGTIESNPCLSILGGIQPSKLRSYFVDTFNDHANDGFLQRFQLIVYPDIPKKFILVDRKPDEEARDKVITIAKVIAESDFTKMGANKEDELPFPIFRFDPEAQKFFNGWLTQFKNQQLTSQEEEVFVQHLSKFPKLLPSLALINCVIRVADTGVPSSVSLDDVKLAFDFCTYLEGHARRVYSIAEQKNFYKAKTLLQKLKEGKLDDGFTLRIVYKKCWSGLDYPKTAEAALDILIDRGWLREEDVPSSARGGAPTIRYRIHPILLKTKKSSTETTDNTEER